MNDKIASLDYFLQLLHVGKVTGGLSFDIDSVDQLIQFLIEEKVLLEIEPPVTEEECANLYDTIHEAFIDSGEDLPDYLCEPNIFDDGTVPQILDFFSQYFAENTDRQLMQVANEEGRHLIAIIPQDHLEQLLELSAQLDIPLIPIESE